MSSRTRPIRPLPTVPVSYTGGAIACSAALHMLMLSVCQPPPTDLLLLALPAAPLPPTNRPTDLLLCRHDATTVPSVCGLPSTPDPLLPLLQEPLGVSCSGQPRKNVPVSSTITSCHASRGLLSWPTPGRSSSAARGLLPFPLPLQLPWPCERCPGIRA